MRVAAWLGTCTAVGLLTAAALVSPARAQSTTTTSPSPVSVSCTPTPTATTTTTTTPSTSSPTVTGSTTTSVPSPTTPSTVTSTPTSSANADPCRDEDKDCADFATQQDAQAYFRGRGGTATNDVDRLDENHNGVACENAADDGNDPNPTVSATGDDGSKAATGGGQVSDVPLGSAQTGEG